MEKSLKKKKKKKKGKEKKRKEKKNPAAMDDFGMMILVCHTPHISINYLGVFVDGSS